MYPMKAAIYIRVSTMEQADQGTSLDTQEQGCRVWCASHDAEVGAVFQDAGASAKTADRPQLLALLSWVAVHRPDLVVVWKFDRWARNATDHAVAVREIGRHGARLVSATEPASDDPAGRLLQTLLAGIAQFDNEIRAERTKTAMRAVALRGGWVTYAPFGFMCARSGTLPILVEHPEQGLVVRDLFAGLADGRRTLLQTVAVATEHGIRPGAARKLLRASVYCGILRSALTGWHEVEAAFPGIVRVETWRAVQVVIAGRSHGRHATVRAEWPLRGVLRCAECGRLVTACHVRGHGGRYGYYQCKAGHVRGRAEAVHTSFLARLREAAGQLDDIMAEVREQARQIVVERLEASQAVQRDAVAAVDSLRARRRRLLDAFLAGAVSRPDFERRDAEIAVSVSVSEASSRARTDWAHGLDDALARCAALLSDPTAAWERMDVRGRQRFARGLFGNGLTLAAGRVQTSESCGLSGTLQAVTCAGDRVAPLTAGWANLAAIVRDLAALAA